MPNASTNLPSEFFSSPPLPYAVDPETGRPENPKVSIEPIYAAACAIQKSISDPEISSSQPSWLEKLSSKERVKLTKLAGAALLNTLDTTVHSFRLIGEKQPEDGDLVIPPLEVNQLLLCDAFLVTGDIDAMWLRDSFWQVLPYIKLLGEPVIRPEPADEKRHRALLFGLLLRQSRCVLIDAHANAFYDFKTVKREGDGEETYHPVRIQAGPWDADSTTVPRGAEFVVHERKFEIDSLACFLEFSCELLGALLQSSKFHIPDYESCFVLLSSIVWRSALRRALLVLSEQREVSDPPLYTFSRTTHVPGDTLQWGTGPPGKSSCGLIRSPFRPSDDAAVFPYPTAANAFCAAAARNCSSMLARLLDLGLESAVREKDAADLIEIIELSASLAEDVSSALSGATLPCSGEDGPVFAFEVDGFGSAIFMDDANVPSLLSMPFFDPDVWAQSPVYGRTRKRVWSTFNPYFSRGERCAGIGSPHVGLGWPWSLSLVMRLLTSDDEEENFESIRHLTAMASPEGLLRESNCLEDPTRYTRSWFAMANSFAGLALLSQFNLCEGALLRTSIIRELGERG